MTTVTNKLKTVTDKLPSIVWVFLIPLAIIAFIGVIVGGFYLLATAEGAASILLLVIAFFVFRAGSGTVSGPGALGKSASFATAIGISFFALMGVAIDQTGNVIYNKPIEMIFCPAGTSLSRGVSITNPLPGRTDINQEFNCVNSEQNTVKALGFGEVILVRFVEYVFIGYLLIWINKLLNSRTRDTKQ